MVLELFSFWDCRKRRKEANGNDLWEKRDERECVTRSAGSGRISATDRESQSPNLSPKKDTFSRLSAYPRSSDC